MPCNFKAILSAREKECLYHFLSGKSNHETAKIMGVASKTVNSFLDKIKAKWECQTTKDVLRISTEKGYMKINEEFFKEYYSTRQI